METGTSATRRPQIEHPQPQSQGKSTVSVDFQCRCWCTEYLVVLRIGFGREPWMRRYNRESPSYISAHTCLVPHHRDRKRWRKASPYFKEESSGFASMVAHVDTERCVEPIQG
jgi:hypothetical protein